MNATEAKNLTEKHLSAESELIKPYLDLIFKHIENAAKDGKFCITNPFGGTRLMWPLPKKQEKIWLHLQNLGYKVKHHPDPDPGHPCSSAYTEISWE